MKLPATIVTLTILGGVTYTALFFYEPAQQESTHSRDTMTTAPAPTRELSPLEQARQELQQATARLDAEEARLLGEIDTASSTAQAQIQELERQIADIVARRDSEVAKLEADIEEINSTRASF